MTADDRSLFCTLGSVTLPLASQRSVLPWNADFSACSFRACVCVCVSLQKRYACTSEWLCVHWQDLMRRHMLENSSVGAWESFGNMKGSLRKLWCERCTMQPAVGALALLHLELLWPSIYLPAKNKTLTLSSFMSPSVVLPFILYPHAFYSLSECPPPFIYSSLTQGPLCPNTASWYAAIEPDGASKKLWDNTLTLAPSLARTPSAITSSPSRQ